MSALVFAAQIIAPLLTGGGMVALSLIVSKRIAQLERRIAQLEQRP